MSKHTTELVMPAAIGSAHAGAHLPGTAMNFAIRLAVAIALAGSLGAAQAVPVLPAAASYVECIVNKESPVYDATGCAVGNTAALVTFAPAVALTASAVYDAVDLGAISGFALLTYSFAVLGGTKDTVVPVDIDFVLQALVFPGGPFAPLTSAYARITAITTRSSGYAMICSSGCTDNSTNLAGTLHVDMYAGEASGNTITLDIFAAAGRDYDEVPANWAMAYADPRIYVDPAFANASAYSIVLSDGVGNGMAPAVPEPETCALMLGGLGALAWVARRRRAGR